MDGDSGKAAVAKAVPRARARDPYLKPRVASASPLPCPALACARPAPAAPGRLSASAALGTAATGRGLGPHRLPGGSGSALSAGLEVAGDPAADRPPLPCSVLSHAEPAVRSSFSSYSHDFPAEESLCSHAQLKLLVSPSPRSLFDSTLQNLRSVDRERVASTQY